MTTSTAQRTNYATTPLADYVTSDFNGDGTSDILWHNTNGDTGIWYLDGTAVSQGTAFTLSDVGVVDPSWTPVGTGDFIGSGKAGILWRNSNGEVGEWPNIAATGPASFTKVDLGAVSTDWVIQGTGDFNGDGVSDILWRNTANGDAGLWYTNTAGGYATADLGVVDPSWSVQGIGDFNADNKSGILWRNTNGEVGLWLNTGGVGPASFTKVDLGNVSTDWVIQGVGDFNGDGVSDILWRNTASGAVGFWFMNASGGYTPTDLPPQYSTEIATGSIQAVGYYGVAGSGLPPAANAKYASFLLRKTSSGAPEEWRNGGGPGFSGFNTLLLPDVPPTSGWNIVGGNPPAVTPVPSLHTSAMAQAMSAMGAPGAGPALAHAAAPPTTTTQPMIAAPAFKFA